jgi:hypothetical protein
MRGSLPVRSGRARVGLERAGEGPEVTGPGIPIPSGLPGLRGPAGQEASGRRAKPLKVLQRFSSAWRTA